MDDELPNENPKVKTDEKSNENKKSLKEKLAEIIKRNNERKDNEGKDNTKLKQTRKFKGLTQFNFKVYYKATINSTE